jgi:exopolysaccharide biosynthesis polyprenyl glycosylphosphotransferase
LIKQDFCGITKPVKKADLFFNALRLPVDFLMICVAGVVTYLLRTQILDVLRPALFEFNLPLTRFMPLVMAVALLFIASFAISGLYSLKVRMTLTEEFLKILVASSAAIMAVIITIFLRQELFNSRFLVLGGWGMAIVFVCIGRLVVRSLQKHSVARYDFGIHRLMVIGDDVISLKIVQDILSNRASGYRLIKHLENPDIEEVRNAIGNPGVDEVILANPNYPAERIVQLVEFCNEHHIIFKFIPNMYQTLTSHIDIDVINGVPLIELKRTPLDGWGRIIKRVFDIIAAIFGLIILSPLFAIVAFAIKWETAGPVFARLRRVSRNREFDLLKFRGMIENAEELKPYLMALNERNDGPLFKMKEDPRVTKVGKFIRKYRIDELAQFWNILMGDMSLVGPRPHQPDEIAQYAKHHKRVLAIKAGATGLAQASGSSDLPFEEEIVLDTFYIENWSLWTDIKIIFTTALRLLRDRSAV